MPEEANRDGLDRQFRMIGPVVLTVALCAGALWLGLSDSDDAGSTSSDTEPTATSSPEG